MRFARPRPRNDDERILPLINVVFLLLIFFMLAGRFSAADPFQIDPPRSASEGVATERDILVLVGADGRLALDGDIIEEAALGAAVADRLSSDKTMRLWLKADGSAEATRVVEVMELLRAAGAERLRLLTVTGGG